MRFNEKFAPVMYRYIFFEAPTEKVVDTFIQWQKWIEQDRKVDHKIVLEQVGGDFDRSVSNLFPLKSSPDRFLFVPTNSRWTLYLNNNYSGSDRVGIRPLVWRMKSSAIYIVAKPHSWEGKGKNWRGTSGARILEFHEPEIGENTRCRRRIWLEHDIGKWTFELEGEPYPFEDLAAYKKRRKTDRFTFEMMKKYLGEFGIRPFDEDFYNPNNASLVVLEGIFKGVNVLSFASYEEVRKYLRIDHLYEDSD